MTNENKKELVPSYINQNSTKGNETIDQDDITPLSIILLQQNSTFTSKVDGAQEGDMYIKATNELYKELDMVFIKQEKNWAVVEVVSAKETNVLNYFNSKREAELDISQRSKTSRNQIKLRPNIRHIGLQLMADNTFRLIVIPIKIWATYNTSHKQLNTLLVNRGGDRFNHLIKVGTMAEPKNGTYVYGFEAKGYAPENLVKEANRLYDLDVKTKDDAYEAPKVQQDDDEDF